MSIGASAALLAVRAVAREAAASRRQRFITVEHLLLGIARTDDGITLLRGVGADPEELARELDDYLDLLESGQPREPQLDPTADLVVRRALLHAHFGGRSVLELGDVLVQMLREESSYAALLFHAAGIERLEVVRYVSHAERSVQPTIPDSKWLTVRLHNDHYTPMDFVVHVLVGIFRLPVERAQALMMQVHGDGSADVTTMRAEDAIERATETAEAAEREGFPLKVTLERAE